MTNGIPNPHPYVSLSQFYWLGHWGRLSGHRTQDIRWKAFCGMLLEIEHAWLGRSDTQSSRIVSQDRFQYCTLPCLGMLHITSDYLVFRAFWTSQHFCWTGRQQQDGSQRGCGDGIIVMNTCFSSLPNLNLYYKNLYYFPHLLRFYDRLKPLDCSFSFLT